ncbi:MAG: flavodoxin-dependent (E)-4-hydroxy-3-methylbut-2-enyl-diphosphate synthase [candidate division WOR-3 bacterium]|nr:MAG: flavodoxin-dependent (E)-4-hydroxy-3-methylbut-2-enyl-diphosphate synthase [candidate division WOR-3 bacterium]
MSRTRRNRTRRVRVGTTAIGGKEPVRVQSMTNTRTDDIRATLRQIRRLEQAGCELVRVAVPDHKAAAVLPKIRERTDIPLIADIHFDHRLALAAIRAGVDKVRINPGNIGSRQKVKNVVRAAQDRGVAIRVGVNAGSIEKKVLQKHRHPCAEAMVESLEHSLEPFEQLGFKGVVLSAKSTSGPDTIEAYRQMAKRWRYPLHLGLTEAGLKFEGAVRSAAVLGVLLNQGIGDTIRVSLTGDPVPEVVAGFEILRALGIRDHGPVVYSCPTCGRTEVDVEKLAREVSRAVRGIDAPLKIAVMGCVVNGPGEAREADFGIAGGRGKGALFVRGRVVRTCASHRITGELVKEMLRARNA